MGRAVLTAVGDDGNEGDSAAAVRITRVALWAVLTLAALVCATGMGWISPP